MESTVLPGAAAAPRDPLKASLTRGHCGVTPSPAVANSAKSAYCCWRSLVGCTSSRAGLQWYLDQYHNGLANTAANIGAGWCGEAFGLEQVAIAFEGNWIGPAMESTYPDVEYTVSAIPAGPAGQATLSFTVGYGMHPNTPNPEASWALLSYLTGQEGMQEWVDGGLVLPAREDVQPTSDLQQQYADFAEFATAGEGVTPQWPRVSDAFNGALGAAATPGSTVDSIVDATLPVLQEVTTQ